MYREAWGKTDEGRIHPLAHHCMDVAAVFERMLELPVVRDRLETAAGGRLTETVRQRLAALAFLHDAGKLHPGFQAKGWPDGLWPLPVRGHLKEGWAFLTLAYKNCDHPFHATLRRIEKWAEGEAVFQLEAAAFAHHGRPVEEPAAPTLRDWNSRSLPHYDWRREAKVFDAALRRWFPGAFELGEAPLPEANRFHHAVAGLLALADWIGSDTRFFPYSAPFDFGYAAVARDRAGKALAATGFDAREFARRPAPGFRRLTGHASPNPAQTAAADIDSDARLTILEAETGSGKTEAALWRFVRLFAAGKVAALYFAVPTRAAARQLHGRVDGALRRAFGEIAPEAVLAIPGVLRAGEFDGQRLPHWKVKWDDDKPAPRRWAAEHATRFLAATVAVGTVDQAMLAALKVKHAHLRGGALDRSLLVIDEVHASDSYMTAILRELLDGHLAAGGHAMLMSATLGARARAKWLGQAMPPAAAARAAPYPAIWVAGKAEPRAPCHTGRSKTVCVETAPAMGDHAGTARRAIDAARRGARVLVVRNTVDYAVRTWRALREAGGGPLSLRVEGRAALHHGRFAAEDRALLDAAVETQFSTGKARRPEGRIAVGTQTLEQSLDIDADFLIADLCPMDVLLQRIGRLHRHALARPSGFEEARVCVLLPENGLEPLVAPRFVNGLGAWEREGAFNGIYRDLAALELTRRAVECAPTWRIPEMNRDLVEGATHPECIAALIAEKGERWIAYDRKVGGVEAAAAMVGRINALDRAKPLCDLKFPSSDESIVTRLGEEGVVLPLDPPPEGPFGRSITRIALPARWSRGLGANDRVQTRPEGGELIVSVGEQRFRYSNAGLERADRCR